MPLQNKSTTPPTYLPPDEYGRVQPQATELEKAVLGALMIENDAYAQVGELLRPESFYEHRHQIIFEAIRILNFDQRPVDILTVAEQLRHMGKLAEVGGEMYIMQLSSLVSTSAHLVYHARIIAQKHLARELISYTSMIQQGAFDETIDVDDLMQEAEARLFEISQQNMRKDYTQIDPIIEEARALIEKAAGNVGGLSGVPSGYPALDNITGGWQKSDLIILAARPAMGKTAFALSMAKNIAVDQKIPMAFFSLEMSGLQLIHRLISNICEMAGDKLRKGDIIGNDWNVLDANIQKLYGAPLYVDDTASLSIFELRTKARRLVREHHVRLIMVDYLQLMNASGVKTGNRQEEVSTISRSLKGLAKELNIPIIALSQVSRKVADREGGSSGEGKRPQLSDLRESGAIEQDADLVIFIHRPEYYRIYADAENKSMRGKAEIIIAKHRNGSVGEVVLDFKGIYARFDNPDDKAFVQEEVIESRANDEPSGRKPAALPPPEEDNPFPDLPPSASDVPY